MSDTISTEPVLKTLPRPPAFRVDVTQEQIDTALPKNSGHCMLADSLKICFKKKFGYRPLHVQVDLQTIRISDAEKGVRFVYLTPPRAQRALLQFDDGIKPTPFPFRLNPNGAQVVPIKTGKKPRTERQRKQSAKALEMASRVNKAKARAETVSDGREKNKRYKVGGKTPPTATLRGNRRQFGLRAMGNLHDPT